MSKSVLVIDDDKAISETLRIALELEGYQVSTAGNGKEAIEILPTIPFPCMIFLDLMMPIMDGWGFIEALENDKQHSNIPVVVITAFSDRAKQIKAKRIIKKPLDIDIFYQAVRDYC